MSSIAVVIPDASELPRASAQWLVTGVLVVAFGLIFNRLDQSRTLHLQHDIGADRLENTYAARQANTTLRSTLGYGLVGLLGAACFAMPALRRQSWNSPVTLLCGCFFLWCAASFAWSEAPVNTIRKSAILGLMLLGAFGAARRLDLSDVCAVVMWTTLAFLLAGLAAEIALGTFQPWHGDYRFGGTVHPNEQAVQCGLLGLVVMFGPWRGGKTSRMVLIALALTMLVLTKSRTSLIAMALAVLIGAVLSFRGENRALCVLGLVLALAATGLVATLASGRELGLLTQTFAMGRRVSDGNLSGRLPLWEALAKEVEDRPVAGHGLGGFWSPKRILTYSERFGWQVPHAHNAYLELLLGVGAVGLAIHLLWMAAGGWTALARYQTSATGAELFVACLLVFALVNGLAESKFSVNLAAFLLFLSLAALGQRRQAGQGDAAPSDPLGLGRGMLSGAPAFAARTAQPR